jgi:hypothetical protein
MVLLQFSAIQIIFIFYKCFHSAQNKCPEIREFIMEYQSPVQLSHCQLNFRTPIMIGFVPQNNKEFIFCLNISVGG